MAKDFTKSNKWLRLRKKYNGPFEREVLDYFELLEKQTIALDNFANSLIRKEQEAKENESQCD